jgi:hypothetical protein
VEREAKECEAANAGQWIVGLRLRGHAPAEGAASGKERQVWHELSRSGRGGSHRGMGNARRVRSLRSLLHVEELVAQRRNAALRQSLSIRFHCLVPHARACPMGEQVERRRARRAKQEGRDLVVAERNRELLNLRHSGARLT